MYTIAWNVFPHISHLAPPASTTTIAITIAIATNPVEVEEETVVWLTYRPSRGI